MEMLLKLIIWTHIKIVCKMKELIQHSPPHPGEILQELYFEPLGLSVTEGAQHLLITRPNLSAIINSKAGISPLMAVKLGKAFKTTPHYWLSLQANYDLWQITRVNRRGISKVAVLA